MMELQNNILVLISVGNYYNDLLVKDFSLLEDKAKIVIFTDKVSELEPKLKNKAEILPYKSKVFKYFDKFYLTYNIAQREKQPVAYLDVKRLNYIYNYNLFNFDNNKIDCIYRQGAWQDIPNSSILYNLDSKYFEKGYWNNIIEFMENKGLDITKIIPFLERCFVVPYVNFDKVIESLKEIQPLFEENSLNKENVYSGIGNGEGLALGYSLLISNVDSKLINNIPSKLKLL